MRRIVFAVMSTLTAVVLLFGYRTSTPSSGIASTPVAAAAPDGAGTRPEVAASPAPTSAAPATAPAGPGQVATPPAAAPRAVAGQSVHTRWGPVQVQITVSAGTVTDIAVLQQPDGNQRDLEINSRALPVLTQEALQAQSSQIDSVSGATYTSQGYQMSLQSALDAAGL